MLSTGTVALKLGALIAHEPVSGTAFVGGKMYFTSKTGGAVDITDSLGQTFVSAGTGPGGGAGSSQRFRRSAWTELP